MTAALLGDLVALTKPRVTALVVLTAAGGMALAPAAPDKTAAEPTVEDLRRTKSSPLVRKIAQEHGVDISQLEGTGVSGRVTKNDILDYISNKDVFHYADGFVSIPQGPGLGIEVDEQYVIERAKEGHRWRNPIWRHADGSVAEW